MADEIPPPPVPKKIASAKELVAEVAGSKSYVAYAVNIKRNAKGVIEAEGFVTATVALKSGDNAEANLGNLAITLEGDALDAAETLLAAAEAAAQ